MSSDYDILALLTLVNTNLYKFGGPILIGVGTVSCILGLLVFTRKNLRKNPCSIYFVAYNISNFFLIYTSVLFSILSTNHNIDPSAYNLGFCRFRLYTVFLFDVLSPCYLILASIDRILITSRNALIRQRSTPRLAYICIIIVTLFWFLFHSHALFLSNLVEFAPGYFICNLQAGIYTTLINYYAVIKVIFTPLLMIIFGLWALKNLRSPGRVAPAFITVTSAPIPIRRAHAVHSKDRQLLQILLVDIGFYIFFYLMIVVVRMYGQITQNPSQTFVKTEIIGLFESIGIFSTYIPYCIGCYTNLFVSKTFRQELKNILMCK